MTLLGEWQKKVTTGAAQRYSKTSCSRNNSIILADLTRSLRGGKKKGKRREIDLRVIGGNEKAVHAALLLANAL